MFTQRPRPGAASRRRSTPELALLLLVLASRSVGAQQLDYTLADGIATPPMPIHLASGKVHVAVDIGDWGAHWLLLDTGANVSILNLAIAEHRGLELRGHGTARDAAGNDTFRYAFTELPRIVLPGLIVEPRTVAVIDRQTEAANGHRSAGLIGADLMASLVVEVDYLSSTLRLHDPDSFDYSGDGSVIPVELDANGKPHIQAEIVTPSGEVLSADLIVDTGDRGLLTLSRPFVVQHALDERLASPVFATVGFGIGGEVRHGLARIGSLKVGGLIFEEPYVELPPEGTSGALAREDRSGVLGARFLRRFHVFFDYPHQRLILEPGPGHDAPFEFDGSGAFLVATGDDLSGVEVLRVAADSPAADAGLEDGDVLLAIDGQPASSLGLDSVRHLFKLFGRHLDLRVQRGSQVLALEIDIRRQV